MFTTTTENSLFRNWILLLENTISHFLSFHGWHLITENHVIWLVGMCRWWRVFYFCIYSIWKMYPFFRFLCNSNISRQSLALSLGRKSSQKWGHVLCSRDLIILQIWNSSGTTDLAQDHIDQKTLKRDRLTQYLVFCFCFCFPIGQGIVDQRGLNLWLGLMTPNPTGIIS